MIDTNEHGLLCKLLLTDRQVATLHKAFPNHLSTNIKVSKT